MEALTKRKNVIVIADEAHRSQYGLEAKEKDGKVSFGFAKHMRDALPNASFIGFTGTPVELSDKNTPALFGEYIDIYDLTQAVKDKTTVPIYYESRIAKLDIPQEFKPKIDSEYEEIIEGQEETYAENQKRKWARLEAIVGKDSRIDVIVKDLLQHYDLRQRAISGKVMFVAMSRKIAVKFYDAIVKYRPKWHNDDVDMGSPTARRLLGNGSGINVALPARGGQRTVRPTFPAHLSLAHYAAARPISLESSRSPRICLEKHRRRVTPTPVDSVFA